MEEKRESRTLHRYRVLQQVLSLDSSLSMFCPEENFNFLLSNNKNDLE